jgi:hypothetical protein
VIAALAELSKNSVVVDEIYMSAFLPKVTCDVLSVTLFLLNYTCWCIRVIERVQYAA